MNNQFQETFELGNKRNQTRLLEQIHQLSIQQKKKLLINILKYPIQQRKQEIMSMLRILMQKIEIFEQFQTDKNEFEAYDYCLLHLQCETFVKNDVIFEIGDQTNNVYIVITGQVSLYLQDDKMKQRQQVFNNQKKCQLNYSDHTLQKLIHLNEIKEWNVFGEQYQKIRINTAVCDMDCQLVILNKEVYQKAIQIMDKKKEQKRMKTFTLNPSFQGLNRKLLNLMLFSFSTQDYKYRDIIYKKDQLDSDVIYIIKQGEFVTYLQKQNVRKQLVIMNEGEFFGDYEAFENVPRQFNVSCHSHFGCLIVIPLQVLYSKLSQFNEQHYLKQLKKLCIKKNKWYKQFEKSIEITQEIYQKYLNGQELKNGIESESSQQIEQVIHDSLQQTSPIRQFKQTQKYLTSIEESQINNKINNNNKQKINKSKNKNFIYIPSPDEMQPLPKVQFLTNRQQDRNLLSTPDRFNKAIKSKMDILKRMNNLSPTNAINFNTLYQKTYYVQLPKQIKLEQNSDKEWPIKATIYLNDLDDRVRYQNNSSRNHNSNSNNNSNRNTKLLLPEQQSLRCEQSELNSQRNSKVEFLNKVQNLTQPKKRRALSLKYKEYLESQFLQKTERSLLLF
ncbi:unnamed protein product [Paramecium sonneborni]|uniref:Cyclic nucleotide-binding domain-containing protein n=1 Tax=Paramecium sonneborni TaxID=65129 RepID=A0A8S1R2Z4_9CILI|nr:unnamed protein product [Paramecium sonneborni]